MSAYIYKSGYRNINNGIINRENSEICCDNSKVNYKINNEICKYKGFNNINSLKLYNNNNGLKLVKIC